jgi:hypothetical protein
MESSTVNWGIVVALFIAVLNGCLQTFFHAQQAKVALFDKRFAVYKTLTRYTHLGIEITNVNEIYELSNQTAMLKYLFHADIRQYTEQLSDAIVLFSLEFSKFTKLDPKVIGDITEATESLVAKQAPAFLLLRDKILPIMERDLDLSPKPFKVRLDEMMDRWQKEADTK